MAWRRCRRAELGDYLQADELGHVRLATRWIRHFTDDKPEPRLSFQRGGEGEEEEETVAPAGAYGGV